MSRLVLSLLSLAAVHGFAPAKTPFALGRAGVRYAGVGDDEIFAAASACLDEECIAWSTAKSITATGTVATPHSACENIHDVARGNHKTVSQHSLNCTRANTANTHRGSLNTATPKPV